MINTGSSDIKLIRSRVANLYEVKTNQFLKTCIAQNFVSSPSLILGETPRIICVDVNSQTKVPIYHYFPLHKSFFMYFGNYTKIVNRQQVEGFLRFVIQNNIYSFESNIGDKIKIINIVDHLQEIIDNPNRIVCIYTLPNCIVQYMNCDCSEYIINDYYGEDGIESYKKSKTNNVPLFFNIVEKERKLNIVGFIDKKKIQDMRLVPVNNYKYVRANILDYFRQIVVNNIGDLFEYNPWIYPESNLQHQMLLELYKIPKNELLNNYRYIFLLKSKNSNRYCLYPLNFNIFERIDIDQLQKDEIQLISDYYLVPISGLKHKHIHFMPIENTGRSFLLLDNDVLLHKYSTDPPNNWNGIESYIYKE